MPAKVKRAFADIEEGQMHYRTARPSEPEGKRPLVLFHASPGSSLSLTRLIAAFGETRTVVAFDTLGQGDSSPPRSQDMQMSYFAEAVSRALDDLGEEFASVDLMGTHTGARIAAELAILAPSRVNRLIIDGMRRGPDDVYREYAASVDLSKYIDQEGTQFFKAWNKKRDQYLFFPPYKRDAAHLRAHSLPSADVMHDTMIEIFKGLRTAHIAYQLALLYPTEERFPLISVPVMVSCARNDGPFSEIDYIHSLLPGSTRFEHPQKATLQSASQEELLHFADVVGAWLDQ